MGENDQLNERRNFSRLEESGMFLVEGTMQNA